MEKDYFYIEEIHIRGPFKFYLLREFNLPGNTLIWCEGMSTWTRLADHQQLAEERKLMELPPHIVHHRKPAVKKAPVKKAPVKKVLAKKAAAAKVKIKEKVTQLHGLLYMQIDTMKQWYLPKTLWVLPVLFGLLALTDMLYMNFQHEAQKEEINIRINSILGDKASVSDGENPEAIVKGHKTTNQDSVFEPEKGSGYVIKKLTRGQNDTFKVETINAGRIQFDGPVKPAVNHESNFQEYYNGAYNYYTKDDQTGSFSHGKLNDINSFPTLRNKYWAMNPVVSKTPPPPDICANLTSANAKIYDHKNIQNYMVTDITKKFPVEERSLIGLTFAGLAFLLVLAGFLNPDYFIRPVPVKSAVK